MFDSSAPPRPAGSGSISPVAMLPLFRARGMESTLEGIAIMAAGNAMVAARAKAMGQPAGDTLDDATPAGHATQSLTLLADIAALHRAMTGEDGLQFATVVISHHFGPSLASKLIDPLREIEAELALDFLLDWPLDDAHAPVPPTRAEITTACRGLAAAWLSDPRLDGLQGALARVLVEGRTSASIKRVQAILAHSATQGVTRDDMQSILDLWTRATGGPSFHINAVDD